MEDSPRSATEVASEGGEIGQSNPLVTVRIQSTEVRGISCGLPERTAESSEVIQANNSIPVVVAVFAEKPVNCWEYLVSASRPVAVAIKLDPIIRHQGSVNGQLIVPIPEASETCHEGVISVEREVDDRLSAGVVDECDVGPSPPRVPIRTRA